MENDKIEISQKALYIKDLNFLTDKVITSGHPVSKIKFMDFDGTEKLGFFKPLDDTYPELLAILNVCGSGLLNLALAEALGGSAAEERLVFNEKREIIGSVSINLNQFIPFSSLYETTKEEKNKEFTEPSVHTLLEYNIALILVAKWFIKDDDGHPGNIGSYLTKHLNQLRKQFCVIDFDMIWYQLTHIIKGKRWSCGILTDAPEKALDLKWEDIHDFPCVKGRTHWPSYDIPGNLYKPKTNKSFSSFQKLAENPEAEIEINGEKSRVSFQKQMFEAMLQHVLAYDPELLRARLNDYIGNVPLDFLNKEKLDPAKAEKLSKFNASLFNSETNNGYAIDVIMSFIQREYDKFYLTTVLYPGCEKNNAGISVPSFRHFLLNNPSAFHAIKQRLMEENEKIKKTHQKYQGNIEPILFNLKSIETRYFQVLRDSHLFVYNGLLNQYEELISEMAVELEISQHLSIKKNFCLQLDYTITESSQLISRKNIELNDSQIKIEPNNLINKGFLELIHYVNGLYDICTDYVKIPQKQLKIDDSQNFCKKIMQLGYSSEKQIEQSLIETNFEKKFIMLQTQLEKLTIQFKMHESEFNSIHTSSNFKNFTNLVQPNHIGNKVIETCTETLFNWAKKIDLKFLTESILYIVNNHYDAPTINFFAKKKRKDPVTEYLKTSETLNTPGDEILANILSKGGRDLTSLNTQIIFHLIDIMLRDLGSSQMDVNLTSVSTALKNNTFNLTLYTNSICNEAQKRCEPKISKKINIIHFINRNNLDTNKKPGKYETFNNLIYKWAGLLDRNEFCKIIKQALEIYSPKPKGIFSYASTLVSNKNRKTKVLEYLQLKNMSNSRILALIFNEGAIENNSLNTILFNIICDKMISMGASNEEFKHTSGFSILIEMKTNKDTREKCLKSLSVYSKDWTYPQDPSETTQKSQVFSLNYEGN